MFRRFADTAGMTRPGRLFGAQMLWTKTAHASFLLLQDLTAFLETDVRSALSRPMIRGTTEEAGKFVQFLSIRNR